MANSTNISTTTLPIINPAEIIFSGISCLTIGVLSIIFNTLTFLVIIKNKKLHTPCFTLLAAHAICGWLMAIGFIDDGIQRLCIYFNLMINQYSRLSCYFMHLPKSISIPASAIFTCMIGLDRLYGIAFPTQYQKNGKKFIYATLAFGSLDALLNVLIAGVTAPAPIKEQIMCFNLFSAFHPLFTRYYSNQNLAFCLLSVGIYGSIVLFVKCKHSKLSNDELNQNQTNSSTAKNNRFIQSQLSILPMIKMVMVFYFFFGVCPEIMVSASAVILNGIYQPKVVLYGAILKVIGGCTDFVILLMKSREFKITLKRILRIGITQVDSVGGGSSNRTNVRVT